MNTKGSLELGQELRQGQHLSPVQVRFVRMLEMTGPEFEDEVTRELDDNPALCVVEDPGAGGNDVDFNESADELQAADFKADDRPEYMHRTYDGPAVSIDINPAMETMADSLLRQLDLVDADDRTLALARYLVSSLDDNGRLMRTLTDIADDITVATGMQVTRGELAVALDLVRQLDPVGVGATDLRDCLLLQLERSDESNGTRDLAVEIVKHHFDLLSKKHFDKLQKTLGVDRRSLSAAMDVITSLNPKPGNSPLNDRAQMANVVIPDFTVTPDEDMTGRFTVSLRERIPELAVEESFDPAALDTIRKIREGDAALFIKRKHDEAQAFIGLVKRRSATLLAVIKAIVAIQKRFFETEDEADIVPMILKDVSALTGLDVSVVSRSTAGKYLATPTGVYPLKMFFNERAIETVDAATPEILDKLRKIIEAEDKQMPYSDLALSRLMSAAGFDLARRTIAKYREKMQIPVARLRKKI